MWEFVADDSVQAPGEIPVPFFEDARADFAPYYRSREKETGAQRQVSEELAKLGAVGILFQPGYFSSGKRKRYGYSIRFSVHGAPGVVRVAGLPLRSETVRKVEQVRIQALLNARDWFKSAVTAQVFMPIGVLTPFMIADHERDLTVLDVLTERLAQGQVPRLPAPQP